MVLINLYSLLKLYSNTKAFIRYIYPINAYNSNIKFKGGDNMLSTYSSNLFNLAQYTAVNNTLSLIEVCDILGNITFQICFKDTIYHFSTINCVADFLLNLSLQQSDNEIDFLMLNDIDEILTFLEDRFWNTDHLTSSAT